MLEGYQYQNTFAKGYVEQGLMLGLQQGKEEGLKLGEEKGLKLGKEEGLMLGEERGLAKGKEEGLMLGFQQGEERGKAEEAARVLMAVLEARGLSVSSTQRKQIKSCTELFTLEQWVRRAAIVSSAEQVFCED